MPDPTQQTEELETILELMEQACVSAYEAGLGNNTKATFQLDSDCIRSRLLAWHAHSLEIARLEARMDENMQCQKIVKSLFSTTDQLGQMGAQRVRLQATLDKLKEES